jgi:putative membrane protein
VTERSKWLVFHYLHGLLMGSADIVPGISGGTVALIVGIYERLIASVRAAASAAFAVLRLDLPRVRERLDEVHWRLVLPLGAGIVTALAIGARIIPGLLESYPVQSRALFFGLIAGSLAIPWRRMDRRLPVHYFAAAGAAVVAFLLVGLPPRVVADPSLIIVFLAASVAICAMILPGVSGSFLLLVMGMYEPTLRALNARDLLYVGIFIAGAAIGLGLFSKLLGYLLDHHHDLTMAALVGLMVGSLRALWPYLDEDRTLLAPPADASVMVPLMLALFGFLLVTLLVRMGTAAERTAEAKH